MKETFNLFVLSVLFFLMPLCLEAQQQGMVHYTVNDGLPSSNVYRVFRDSKGYMWVCTDKGIARFDGYKFEVFTTKDGLPYNDIWNIQEDSKGRLWLSSYSSHFTYYSYADKTFHSIVNSIDRRTDIISAYQETPDGDIIALTDAASITDFTIKDNKIQKKSKNASEGGYFQKTIYLNPEFRHPYIIYDITWHQQNELRLSIISEHSVLSDSILMQENIEKLWILQKGQLLFFTTTSFVYSCNLSAPKKYKRVAKKDINWESGDVIYNAQWVSADIFCIKTQRKSIFLDTNLKLIKDFNLGYIDVYNTILLDNNRHVWICTPKDGLYYTTNDLNSVSESSIWLENYRNIDKKSKIISKITKDKEGNIWYGTSSGEVYSVKHNIHRLEFGDGVHSPVKNLNFLAKDILFVNWGNNSMMLHKINARVNSTKARRLTNIYEARFDSVAYYYYNGRKTLSYDYFFFPATFKSIACLSDSSFLLTSTSSIYLLKLSKAYYTISFPRPSYGYRSVIFTAEKKYAWMSSNEGLYYTLYSGIRDIAEFPYHPPLVSKSITDMQLDSRDGLWFGTDGDGLYLFREGKAYAVKELEHEIIKSVFVDKLDQVWASTNKGAFRVSVSDYKNFKYTLTRFSLAQGLPSKEVNCVYANDTMAWICTQMGLVTIDLKARATATEVPLFYINRIITDSDTLDYTGRLVLPYNHSRVELDYVCLSFMSNRNITYLYRLEGADTVWRQTEDLKLVYPILPVGQYTLRIKALDINGRQSNEAVIEITITPPFWQTWWFRSLVLLVIACVAGILIYRRIKKIRREESEKTRINKKFAELELQALQAQMNPHFVFNSLNAIQSFVLKQDAVSANDYLSKFSTLMRLFLESSRQKYISIEEELKLITLYTQMEQMRFKDKFGIVIRISGDIRRHSEIPSMLLQPFVENAINHGLVYRDGHGSLEIEFTREDTDTLVVRIEDDGIGRQAAMEIKRKSIKSYRSRAMEITEERLKTMHIIDDTDVKITIIDKTDENGKANGTKVMITVNIPDV